MENTNNTTGGPYFSTMTNFAWADYPALVDKILDLQEKAEKVCKGYIVLTVPKEHQAVTIKASIEAKRISLENGWAFLYVNVVTKEKKPSTNRKTASYNPYDGALIVSNADSTLEAFDDMEAFIRAVQRQARQKQKVKIIAYWSDAGNQNEAFQTCKRLRVEVLDEQKAKILELQTKISSLKTAKARQKYEDQLELVQSLRPWIWVNNYLKETNK